MPRIGPNHPDAGAVPEVLPLPQILPEFLIPIELLQVPSPNCFTRKKEKRIAQDEGGDANQNEAILPYENSIEPPSSRAAFLVGLGTEDPQIAVVEAMATGGEGTQIADTAGTGCSL
ncbi:hypothetical protein MMC22_002622 [Lobaria immixta]|nr:hypothetical protein [Lobaria immixta]